MAGHWITAAKRGLRESPVTSGLYLGAARSWHATRIGLHKLLRGRYHTAAYFDRLFARSRDPWRYEGDAVSEARRDLLIRTLPDQRCRRMLEIGCAAGWITERLAQRAEAVLAVDISPSALEKARERCVALAHVEFRCVDLLHDEMRGRFDTIVCAGVLTYLPRAAQQRIRDRLAAMLEPGGHLLLEHLGEAGPGECAGSRIHALYGLHPELTRRAREARDGYEILLLRKDPQAA